MYEFHDIRTQEDAQQLLELFNGFHDAYITNYTYQGNVRSNCSTTSASIFGTELSLTFMITSMKETPVVEIVFQNVLEWHIRTKNTFLDVFGLLFDVMPGTTVCTAGCTFDRDVMEKEHYVIANSARWRLIDLPGLRLTQQKRGGVTATWRYISLPVDCPTEDLMSIFRQLEQSTSGGKLAIVRPAGTAKDGLFAPENLLLTTETLPSFMQEEAIPAPAGEPFEWYRITDDADLRLALEYAMNGSMLGVIEDGHYKTTAELIHTKYTNVVYHDWPLCQRSIYFCDNKYISELYLGGGVEEFGPTPVPTRRNSKYKSVNEAELFEFHDAEVNPFKSTPGFFHGTIRHLNIHSHTVYNPEEYDKELASAHLQMDGFRLSEEDEAITDAMHHPFTVLKLDVEKADGHFIAKLEAVTEEHKSFSCTFYFDTIKISWTYYLGKAWYVKPPELNK